MYADTRSMKGGLVLLQMCVRARRAQDPPAKLATLLRVVYCCIPAPADEHGGSSCVAYVAAGDDSAIYFVRAMLWCCLHVQIQNARAAAAEAGWALLTRSGAELEAGRGGRVA